MSVATEKKHKEIMMNNIFCYFFKRIRLDKEDILSCETVGDLVWKIKFFFLKENLSPCEWWYSELRSRMISKPNFHRWALISYSSDEYQKILELAKQKLSNPEMDNGITADDIEQYNDAYVGYVPDAQYDPAEDESDDPSDFETDHLFPQYDDTHDDSCSCQIIKKEVEKILTPKLPTPKSQQVPVLSPKPDTIMFPDAVEPLVAKPRGRPRKDGLPPGSAPTSKRGLYKPTGRPIGRPRLDGRPAGQKTDDDIRRFVEMVGRERLMEFIV